jgi:X-X-X-Leu-X-X-Gly heptad repeat protein
MASVQQQYRPVDRQPVGNRSLTALFSDLWRETATLVHEEAELAKAELSEKTSQLAAGIGEIATGGAIIFAGFIVLLFAVAGALEQVLPEPHADWLAPLIVGVLVIVIGFIALARGRANMKTSSLAPERTMESLRRDANLAKEHMQ